jgi:hypothetical protein
MMETVLNVGMNELVLERLIATSGGDECFALNVYRLFLEMFGTIVLKASELRTIPPASTVDACVMGFALSG